MVLPVGQKRYLHMNAQKKYMVIPVQRVLPVAQMRYMNGLTCWAKEVLPVEQTRYVNGLTSWAEEVYEWSYLLGRGGLFVIGEDQKVVSKRSDSRDQKIERLHGS